MKRSRKILSLIFLLFIVAVGYGIYVWNKPHRDVNDEQAITVEATTIFNAFAANTDSANKIYLNKAIQVTGEIMDAKKNQDGKNVVYLKAADPIFGVNCTFKEDPGALQKGTTVTIKGICTGYLEDVIINQAVLVKK